jgi:hypothetical protein
MSSLPDTFELYGFAPWDNLALLEPSRTRWAHRRNLYLSALMVFGLICPVDLEAKLLLLA